MASLIPSGIGEDCFADIPSDVNYRCNWDPHTH